ncbi:hypothetical protein [Vandammella animalimorsus]|nr:hypothetical protein [Vandammella animalimorsus]
MSNLLDQKCRWGFERFPLADTAAQRIDLVINTLAARQLHLAQVAQGVVLVLVFGGEGSYRNKF